jgi:hypothetical protein
MNHKFATSDIVTEAKIFLARHYVEIPAEVETAFTANGSEVLLAIGSDVYSMNVSKLMSKWCTSNAKCFTNSTISDVQAYFARKEAKKQAKRDQAKAERQALKEEALANSEPNARGYFKAGAILVSQYGYDCTLTDFYKVLSVKGMTAEIVEIGHKVVSSDRMYEEIIPDPSRIVGEPQKIRLTVYRGCNGKACFSGAINGRYHLSKYTEGHTHCNSVPGSY